MKTAFPIRTALIVAAAIFLHQNAAAGPATVDLGTAADFSILGGTEVTFTAPTTTVIGGDVGVSPGTSITGVPANLSQTGGVIHNNDAVAAGARADTTLAYASAAGALPTTTYLGADNQLGGLTLTAGTYRFGAASTANLIGNLTLSGTGVFIFQATSSLVTASGSSIDLINGADACNIIWQVGSSATLGSSSFFDGTILAQASITSDGGSTIAGRLLAGTGLVSLIGDTIVTDRGCQPGEGTGSFHTTGVPGVVAGVPDSGSTLLLLSSGLATVFAFRRWSLVTRRVAVS